MNFGTVLVTCLAIGCILGVAALLWILGTVRVIHDGQQNDLYDPDCDMCQRLRGDK